MYQYVPFGEFSRNFLKNNWVHVMSFQDLGHPALIELLTSILSELSSAGDLHRVECVFCTQEMWITCSIKNSISLAIIGSRMGVSRGEIVAICFPILEMCLQFCDSLYTYWSIGFSETSAPKLMATESSRISLKLVQGFPTWEINACFLL